MAKSPLCPARPSGRGPLSSWMTGIGRNIGVYPPKTQGSRLGLTARGSEPHFCPMTAENNGNPAKPQLKVLLCSPRGFCAGVVRAIDSVEQALKRYGAPVYVRHEIVHNRYVVESL